MKIFFIGLFLMAPKFVGAQDIVKDAETGIVYETKLTNYHGKIGFVISDKVITDPSLLGGSWRVYSGPAERIPTGPFGEGGMSIKICHATSHWPCMLVRNPNS